MNKRKRQAQKTREMIFNHATELIREKGFYNVSVAEITTAANISVGTFYYYYKSKDDLVLQWADTLDQEYIDYFEAQTAVPGWNALAVLEGLNQLSLTLYSNLGAEFATVSYSYIMRNPEGHTRYIGASRAYHQILCQLIDNGQRNGLLRQDIETESLARTFYKASRGCIMDWCLTGGKVDIVQYSSDFSRCFMDGIKPQDSTT